MKMITKIFQAMYLIPIFLAIMFVALVMQLIDSLRDKE